MKFMLQALEYTFHDLQLKIVLLLNIKGTTSKQMLILGCL